MNALTLGWPASLHVSENNRSLSQSLLVSGASSKPEGELGPTDSVSLSFPTPTSKPFPERNALVSSTPEHASTAAPSPGPTPLPGPFFSSLPSRGGREVVEIEDGHEAVYTVAADGQVSVSKPSGSGLNLGPLARVRELFIPSNSASSVSKDYLPTHAFFFLHDVAFNLGNFASGAAIATALGLSPAWGGAAMATFNMIRDRVSQTVSFGSSFAAPKADRNPRPWILAGDMADTTGMIVESTAAVVPGLVLPIALAGAASRVFGGSMKGAAMANIDPRQAIADNLGEVRAKNGNQGFVASLLGSLGGLVAMRTLVPMLGPTAAPMVTAAAAGAAVLAMSGALRRLDLYPINEQGLRRIVDGQEKGGALPGPDKKAVWTALATLRQPDGIQLGHDVGPLVQDSKRFAELTALYRARKYLLEVKQGVPQVVLAQDCSSTDRFAAALQWVQVERLRDTADFRQFVSQGGPEAGDRWLVTESLKKVPSDVGPMLAELKQAGWSTDMLRFADSGQRARW